MGWVIQGKFLCITYAYILVILIYISDIEYDFFSHGWASSMSAVRSPHIKVICPTAYVINFLIF